MYFMMILFQLYYNLVYTLTNKYFEWNNLFMMCDSYCVKNMHISLLTEADTQSDTYVNKKLCITVTNT